MSAWDKDTEQWHARLAAVPASCPSRAAVVQSIAQWVIKRDQCRVELESNMDVCAFGPTVSKFVRKRDDGDRLPICWDLGKFCSTRTAYVLRSNDPLCICPYFTSGPEGTIETQVTKHMLAIAAALRSAGLEVGFMLHEIVDDWFGPGHLYLYACANYDKLLEVDWWKKEKCVVWNFWVRLPETVRQSCRCGEGCLVRS